MIAASTKDELLACVENVHEYASYASELGIEMVDQGVGAKTGPSVVVATSASPPVHAAPDPQRRPAQSQTEAPVTPRAFTQSARSIVGTPRTPPSPTDAPPLS